MAVFYGSGAYALGAAASAWHFTGTSAFALLPFAAVVGAIIAVPFGLIALRVRRHTFIVITIAVFFIFQLMAYNLSFTHGTSGMNAPFITWPASGVQHALLLHRAGHRGGHDRHRLADPPVPLRPPVARHQGRRGPGARAWRADHAGQAVGVRHLRRDRRDDRAVWFYFIGQVQPNTGFDPLFDLTIVLMAFLGGYGSIAGTVLGALIVEPATLWLNTQPEFSGGYLSEILLGGVFLIVVLFMPRGIVPTGGEWITRLRSRGRPAVIPATRSAARPRGPCPPRPSARAAREVPGDRAAADRRDQEGLRRRAGANGASIAVDEGTVAGLIGPNGSGKTTLFNVITGYDRADEGQVWFGDTVITNAAPDKVFATGIGRTFQLTRIFPRLTVIENMLIAAQARDKPRNLLSQLLCGVPSSLSLSCCRSPTHGRPANGFSPTATSTAPQYRRRLAAFGAGAATKTMVWCPAVGAGRPDRLRQAAG